MIELRRGIIKNELFRRGGIIGYIVDIDGRQDKCIAYPDLTGELRPGEEVILNTSAVSLELGSGGYHFIIGPVSRHKKDMKPGGHIMKLRYTPMQLKVLSVEERESPYHEQMRTADNLNGTPVLVATLHSMLAPMCIKLNQLGLKVAYVMTDGAALPIYFSQTVDWLKNSGMLGGTVTVGHAFGGDLEAVNIYSGLLAAYTILKPDVIVVSMGPGIVGTATKWGFTGIEQGQILNAVECLGGIPLAVPRLSFADQRARHRGISHHTLTVLSRVSQVKTIVPLPLLEEEKMAYILEQIFSNGLFEKHRICVDTEDITDMLQASQLQIRTMGRGVKEDREFFLALGAAAATAGRLVKGESLHDIKPA